MKRAYSIEIDCPNCANKVELACRKIADIKELSINFMAQKMYVEFSQEANEKLVMQQVKKAAKKIEDDFEIEL